MAKKTGFKYPGRFHADTRTTKTPAPDTPAAPGKGWRPAFNLVRWFSLASFFIIAAVALGLGYVSTRFVVEESIERDSMLTAQFIQAIGDAEIRHAGITTTRTMGEMLDPRLDNAYPDVNPGSRAAARIEFLDHVEHLPDCLLAVVYALDRTVVWSTNPEMIGMRVEGDEELDESFEMKETVSTSYHEIDEERPEQKLLREPEYLFVENYIPMFNADKSKVIAMVEIYKEPVDLVARIQRGFKAIWLATLLGGAAIYLGLFWIVRRAAMLLQSQQKQLIANETFVALGKCPRRSPTVCVTRWRTSAPAPNWPRKSPARPRRKTSATSSARSIACHAGSASCWCRCAR
jgi:two-component system sensor histidine kinase HydH